MRWQLSALNPPIDRVPGNAKVLGNGIHRHPRFGSRAHVPFFPDGLVRTGRK